MFREMGEDSFYSTLGMMFENIVKITDESTQRLNKSFINIGALED